MFFQWLSVTFMKCHHGSVNMQRNHGKVVIGRDVSFWAITLTRATNVSWSLSEYKTWFIHFVVYLISYTGHSLVSVHFIMISTICFEKLCPNSKTNQSFIFLVLDDGGCLDSSLPIGIFPSTSTHLSIGMKFIFFNSTLGIAIINVVFIAIG